MIAEIVTIGTELLLGEIVDSNAADIAAQLPAIGVDHYYTTTVGDNEERIGCALQTALGRSDVVITTGGLGPTVDDVTRQAVAKATGRELAFLPEVFEQIEAYFAKRGYTMGATNRRQAFFPQDAVVIENPVGTAPAFLVRVGAKAIISLPGVPHEMRHLLHQWVLPYLSRNLEQGAVILSRMVHTAGVGESTVGEYISDMMQGENPTVGTRAHPGQVDVCITAKAATPKEALELLAAGEIQVRERLESFVYGVDEETLATVVIGDLRKRGLSLALVEPYTGGLIARHLLAVEGGDSVLVSVSTPLDGSVPAEGVGTPATEVDGDAALGAASSCRKEFGTDLALAVLEGGGEEPLIYVALAAPDGGHLNQWRAPSHRDYGVKRTIPTALNVVRMWLKSQES